jgi:hypothetical protein
MICSALQEWIAAIFALRAKTLYEGITAMLGSDHNLRDQILGHPLIDGLSHKTFWNVLFRRPARPSYISAEIFAKAFVAEANLTNATVPSTAPGAATPQVPNLARNNQPLQQNTRQLIQTLLDVAPGDIDVLRKNVEDWYNDGMDRVSGWYKRKTQVITIILGLLLAVCLNADTFMLTRAFWNDPVLRTNAANAAAQWVKTHNRPEESSLTSPNGQHRHSAIAPAISKDGNNKNEAMHPPAANSEDKGTASLYPSVTEGKSEPVPPAEQPYSQQQQEQAEQEYRNAQTNFGNTAAEVIGQIEKIGIPLGWCTTSGSSDDDDTSEGGADGDCDAEHRLPPGDIDALLLKMCGLFVTTIALSQGAPFWFDFLKNVVNLRLTGDAPDEKKK